MKASPKSTATTSPSTAKASSASTPSSPASSSPNFKTSVTRSTGFQPVSWTSNMSIVRSKPLAECLTPQQALKELFTGFATADQLKMDFLEVSPEEIPSASRQLLVHQKHMTRTLNAHYGKPVDVHVMERHHDGDLYSRK